MPTKSTINEALWARWLKHRKEYSFGGGTQFFVIKETPKDLLEFTEKKVYLFGRVEHVQEARWEDRGYVFRARFILDEDDRDLSEHIGEFTDKGEFPHTLKRRGAGKREYQRFKPGTSIANLHKAYWQSGYSSAVAYALAVEQAQKDMARLEDLGNGWHWCGMEVAVLNAAEEELDSTSLWGIESDCGDAYKTEVARELAHQIRIDPHKNCGAQGHLPAIL